MLCCAGIVVGPNLFTPNEIANPMESLMMSQRAAGFVYLTVAARLEQKQAAALGEASPPASD